MNKDEFIDWLSSIETHKEEYEETYDLRGYIRWKFRCSRVFRKAIIERPSFSAELLRHKEIISWQKTIEGSLLIAANIVGVEIHSEEVLRAQIMTEFLNYAKNNWD